MKIQTVLPLTLLTTLTLASAQSMDNMNKGSMGKDGMSMSMMSAPMLRFTSEMGMNMMMGKSNDLMIMAAPGMGNYTYNMMGGHSGTITYTSKNAKALFDFYSSAIKAEGWKEDMNMAMGMMKDGSYSEAYTMGKYKLDLMTMTKGNMTMVTFKTH
ncbi:hypothetical protein [Deinococcus arenicola]|uniref:DUF306 domain-containing protein n=1 Tax=Deinococcus arenicola TaxID=2994950 RepID=A0ABU4DTK0_9DEIO|nr:hypothetical protein [Deinococcus sp. ZS9-10]MDV6375292.1 hypothetical protein [Deinococcus sp. ZS9-10]